MGSGGKLKELSEKNGFKHIVIPSGFPPRTALGYMSITVLAVLAKMGFIKDKEKDVKELYSVLIELRDKEIGIGVPSDGNISKQMASRIHGKYCIIYGTTDSTEAVAVRWRGQLAENSKSLSSSHVLPEMNHNEIVGWEFPGDVLKNIKVIMFYDGNDHIRTRKRIEISKNIISESGAEIFKLQREDANLLARIFSLIYVGDFLSFYLAILNDIDPTPVKRVDYLKAEMVKGGVR
jgi:glucose/mannose-6-phosphate isomerase